MTIPTVVLTVAVAAASLLVVFTALRLRSSEPIIYHLTLYTGLGLVLNVALLVRLYSPANSTDFMIFDRLAQFSLLAVALVFGALTLVFLKKTARTLLTYWIAAGIIAIAWGIVRFDVGKSGATLAGNLAAALSALGWAVALITGTVFLSLELRKRQPLQHLNRQRYWLIATALIGLGGLIIFANPFAVDWAGVILAGVGSGVACYTVLSYQTPDLKLLAGRGLRYAGVTGALAGILLLGIAATITLSRSTGPSIYLLLWAMGVSIIYGVIFPPLWRAFNRLLTTIIFGKQRQDQQEIIKHYSQRISRALDMKRLGDTVLHLITESLGVTQVIIFVNERSGEAELRPLSSVGVPAPTVARLSTDSPFLDYFRRGKKYITQYDIDVLPEFRAMADSERAWLAGLGMEVYVPVLLQIEFVGLLAVGPHRQGTAYSDEELELMVALADQTALAMDSARLFQHLAVVNREVGHLSAQLAGVDEHKSDFLSIASHELRTPLTQIHGFSQMLLELTEVELNNPAYLKTLVEGVARGSERMKGVVDLMFDVTEAGVGEMRLFKGPVRLVDVVEHATRPFLTAIDERRIAFGKSGLKELPVVQADGTRLVQAVENLMGNAIKYTPDGGTITIEGRTCTLNDDAPAIEICVADTGIGIAPEHHEQIFEKFFRVDDTLHHSTGKTKFKGAGPGLGLSLVKGIARAHKGRVWVESPGHDEEKYPGSKFFFVIPARDIVEPEAPPPQKQSQIETRHWRRSETERKADQEADKPHTKKRVA